MGHAYLCPSSSAHHQHNDRGGGGGMRATEEAAALELRTPASHWLSMEEHTSSND